MVKKLETISVCLIDENNINTHLHFYASFWQNTTDLKYENEICGIDLEEMKRALLVYLGKNCRYIEPNFVRYLTISNLFYEF